jgi:ribosome-binding factor A
MSFRIQRAQALLMEEISLIILGDLKDPRVKNVTITGVKMSPDLKNATIYFSVLGSQEDIDHAMEGLSSALGFIRKEISHKLQMRATPLLRFVYDDTLQKAAHISELLEQAKKNERTDN